MTRRSDVYRTESVTQSRAANRALGSEILCCVNQDGGGIGGGPTYFEPCSIAFSVDDSFRRVFFSATVAQVFSQSIADLMGGGIELFILDPDAGITLVPLIITYVNSEAHTITAAIDLAPGDYNFRIRLAMLSFDDTITCGECAMQAIVGQVVSVQECVRTPEGCT